MKELTLPDSALPRSMGRSFAVASGKGGTGKSIITATLAALLARCGLRVLLVDTDVFTSGLSYYLLGSNPRQARVGMQDVLIKGTDTAKLAPVATGVPGIDLIPSVSRARIDASELRVAPSLRFDSLIDQLKSVRYRWADGYDFIIFDTRGGTDQTSVAACLAAGAYIIITEADKTSWDLGDNLVRSIEDAAAESGSDVTPMGFVLNKNVLPPEAIEVFLRRKWSMPHLATVPIDEAAIRAFQNDEIPALTQPQSRFVAALTLVIPASLYDQAWPYEGAAILQNLEARAKAVLGRRQGMSPTDRRAFMLRLYGLLIVSASAAWATIAYGNPPLRVPVSWFVIVINVISFLYVISALMDERFASIVARVLARRARRIVGESEASNDRGPAA